MGVALADRNGFGEVAEDFKYGPGVSVHSLVETNVSVGDAVKGHGLVEVVPVDAVERLLLVEEHYGWLWLLCFW